MENLHADSAFVLLCSALVLFMTPGLALFYGGMVRAKNVLSTVLQSFLLMGLASVFWAVIGYSLAFGPDIKGVIGSLAYAGMTDVGVEPMADLTPNVPHLVFMIFQCMFAIITPALVTGAFAERTKLKGLLVFFPLWMLVVYSPLAHWVWAPGGWLRTMGALDFAGGTVVHICSAATALALILVIGPRIGRGAHPMPPHNLPLTALGAGILWFGWFGFNAGSALAADGVAAGAFVSTHFAASAATLSWLIAEWLHRGKPTLLGGVSGGIAGLVAVTPAAGFVTPMAGLIIGLLAGAVCYGAVSLRGKTKLDDSLDVLGIHGAGGILGALLTGVFATKLVNSAGNDGLLAGNPGLMLPQLVAVLATVAYSFGASWLLAVLTHKLVGLRVRSASEITGLDAVEHQERGYALH